MSVHINIGPKADGTPTKLEDESWEYASRIWKHNKDSPEDFWDSKQYLMKSHLADPHSKLGQNHIKHTIERLNADS
jgi:hypothetical protein